VESVVGRERQEVWREVLSRYHYLGYVEPVGASVKHLVYGRSGALLAALGWQSAVTHLACRDRIIGWNMEQRPIYLDRVATNVRFLILPTVKIRNAASAILAQSVAQLRADWWAKYKVELGLLETFVDRRRFDGACYRAANWVAIGQSKGYAKQQGKHIYHGQRKEVYVYVLDPNLRRKVLNNFQESALNRAYLLSMYFAHPRSERRIHMSVITERWEPKPAPEFDLGGTEVKDALVKELEAYHRLYEAAFTRVEQAHLCRAYLMGLMSKTPRKNVEAMALHLSGPELVRNLQRFMIEQKWDEAIMRRIYWRESAATLAEAGGVLSLDASEIGKKGRESVGVAPQYCGNLGKLANCQSGVYICYASAQGHTLLLGRLYLPEGWFEKAYTERRQKCRVPVDLTFKTKPQIAGEMLQEVWATGLFPCQWMAVDASFGNNETFLQSLPPSLSYLADISCTRKVWLPTVGGSSELESCPVSELLEKPGLLAWEHYKVTEGEKGPVVADFARLRVYLSSERIPANERWLLVCNRADQTLKYSLSNASQDTPIEEMVRVSRYRWPIERSFQEGKGELGLDHYEHRSWPAWHRHMLLVCLAQLFLTRTRLKLKKKPPR
jgi:SRSO17 transposase